ncbi:hypothetical protein ElyMa_001439700 [Elysia marginata]|uniref:Uncharacterized protein n=1 Tax=Elysia marginata TaxID=1093978 RepID=A0AAV4IX66_9GAST|nr:hypothetical protein ElyMa_001439700 [Elysia marginata]
MGAYRQGQTSMTSQPDWMVIPEEDMSDVFIGSATKHHAWSSHQPVSPETQYTQKSSCHSLMTSLVEEYSGPPKKDNGKVFIRRGQGGDQSKDALYSLTSQILSEIHSGKKSKLRQPSYTTSPRESVRPRALEERRHAQPSKHNSNRQRHSPSLRTSEALKFYERSLALNVVRSRSAMSQHISGETQSPRPSTSSDASLSPRETYISNIDLTVSEGKLRHLRTQRSVRVRQYNGTSPDANLDYDATPNSSHLQTTPSSPSTFPQDYFGSNDSGISNPDLYTAEQPSLYSNINKQSTSHRHLSGARRHQSSKDVIHEVSEPDSLSPRSVRVFGEMSADNIDRGTDDDYNDRTHFSVNKQDKDRQLGDGGRDEEDAEEEDDELPEYLDSFQAASAATFRRPSLWARVRDLGASGIVHDLNSTRTTSSLGNSVTSGIGGSSIHSNDAYDIAGRHGNNKKKRCPNCGEELQKAPTRFVAVRGNEKNFLNWLLGQWGKVSPPLSISCDQCE